MNNDYQTEFEFCCNNKSSKKYCILHQPKPLQLSGELLKAIETLLWYAPNLKTSRQSTAHELLTNSLYEDFIFSYILLCMNINKTDVFVAKEISKEMRAYFNEQICLSCDKIIITKNKNETLTVSLLRHLRNSIAHGNFTFVDQRLLAFDEINDKPSAIIKIVPNGLLSFLKELESSFFRERIIAHAFSRLGYGVSINPRLDSKYSPDIILQKNHQRYFIELKEYPMSFIHPDALKVMLDSFQEKHDLQAIRCIILDMTKLTVASIAVLKDRIEIVIDKAEIKDLFAGVDVLESKLYQRHLED